MLFYANKIRNILGDPPCKNCVPPVRFPGCQDNCPRKGEDNYTKNYAVKANEIREEHLRKTQTRIEARDIRDISVRRASHGKKKAKEI